MKRWLIATLAVLLATVALARSEGIYNPSSNAVGDYQGIDSNAATGGGAGLVLDGISTGVRACYSTRKLLTTYAGNAMQVQETTGNTTTNIGFAANVLDTTALSTFCSGKTCKMITWYDQCGGGFDETVAAIGNAPIIYQSGAVNTINSKPAPLFTAANSTYLLNAVLLSNPTNTLYQNAVLNASLAANGDFYASDQSSAYGWQVKTTGVLELDKLNAAAIGTSTSSITASTGAILESQYNSTSGAWAIWVNRVAAGTGTSAQTLTLGHTFIAAGPGPGTFFSGSIGELISYDLVGGISGASQTIIENNQHTYWGTP